MNNWWASLPFVLREEGVIRNHAGIAFSEEKQKTYAGRVLVPGRDGRSAVFQTWVEDGERNWKCLVPDVSSVREESLLTDAEGIDNMINARIREGRMPSIVEIHAIDGKFKVQARWGPYKTYFVDAEDLGEMSAILDTIYLGRGDE